jgi:AcrR family transcriptional regulator
LVGDRSPEAKLIDAAIVAFGEQGFHEVSIAALCERADVAKGTFYRCFDSKQTLFLATAQAVIARATDAFDAEAGTVDPAEHPAVLARHLRHGLPVLFELAKRLTCEDRGDADPAISEAAGMFAGLARRLGHAVDPGAADEQAEPSGGLLIMLALVKIFEELLEAEITRA